MYLYVYLKVMGLYPLFYNKLTLGSRSKSKKCDKQLTHCPCYGQ